MKTEINTVDSNGYNLKYETLNVKKTSYSDIIEECFNLSIENKTKLPNWILSMQGMSGKKYRMFINNLISKIETPRYLEIGCWKGSTLCSAMYSNTVESVAIDDWSEFNGPKEEFNQNLQNSLTTINKNTIQIIELDFKKVVLDKNKKFNIYFFDGPHKEDDHYEALKKMYDNLDDEFIFICDDWNWEDVREGSRRALNDLKIEILYYKQIFTEGKEKGNEDQNSDWHNGYYIAVCKKSNIKKVIDYFPFFNEKELLELRLNLLNEYVDHFIISELNYTHSGIKKDFICQELVDGFGFTDKVTVIEIELSDDDLIPQEIDIYSATESKSSKEVNAWIRERMQRDALNRVIEEYDDDDVCILSDCDEIINPQFIDYFSSVCRNHQSNIVKVPLVLLEGSADKRLYQNDQPVSWMNSLLLCTVHQLRNGATPTQMRSNIMNRYAPIWVTENGELIQDCGWHFTWMGDEDRRVQKANSFIHYANLNSINTLASESIESVYSKIDTSNSFDSKKHTFYKKDYPLENLPEVIFKLPRVKDFLLPNYSTDKTKNHVTFSFCSQKQSTVWIVDNFYDDPYALREFALEQEYFEGGIGRGFIGRRTYKQFLFPGLKEKFEEIMGRKIIAWEEHTENGKFQIAWAGEPLVYHWDSQKWGAVLYLTPDAPFECGTTLFAHKKTRGRNFYEVSYNDAFSGVLNETTTHLDRTPFEPVDVMGNVFNRLVIFDGSCIHSASEYFGCNKNSGRLWQMFFFDTE